MDHGQDLQPIIARFTARAVWLAPRYRRRRLRTILTLSVSLGLGLAASADAGALWRCQTVASLTRCLSPVGDPEPPFDALIEAPAPRPEAAQTCTTTWDRATRRYRRVCR